MKETQQQLDKETLKVKQKAINVISFAYKKLVEGSPTDKGFYRNNHIITANKTTNKINEANKSESVSTRELPIINRLKFNDGDRIIIQNNLNYALKLEAFGGKTKGGRVFPPGLYDRTEHETKKFIKELKWV